MMDCRVCGEVQFGSFLRGDCVTLIVFDHTLTKRRVPPTWRQLGY